LVVIGDGPDRQRLESLAGPTVEFLGRVSDATVKRFASRCRALLFPGEEDFGMTPLEINAAGRPVIAYRAGGALETVVEGVTGVFFDHPTKTALIAAIEEFEHREWASARLRQHAEQFAYPVFAARMLAFLQQVAPDSCRAELRAYQSIITPQPFVAEPREFLAAAEELYR
jgi:glycosyltransferase involved in cell wall biosynthesis